MIEAYRPISLLVVLWPTQEFEFPEDAAALGQRMREQFTIFKGQRIVQSAVGKLPAELTRLALVGEGNAWLLELAPGKISLRLDAGRAPRTLSQVFEGVQEQLAPLHAWLAENHNLRVYRVGTITQLFCNTRSSASEKIAGYFLQPRALQGQRPSEIQLGVHARFPLGSSIMVNRWVRVRPLRSTDARHVDFAAQIEVDINTMIEDTQIKTGRDLAQFLEAVRIHIDRDLPLLQDADFLA